MPELARSPLAPASWLPPPGFPHRMSTLLLVEDSRHAAEAVRLFARRLGLRLRRAETLAAAEHHLRVYRPDVALIDLGLPDGSGLELIARLAGMRPRLRRIVAISADPDLGGEALAAGACAFVAKPLRLPADLPALLGPAAPALPDTAPDPVPGGAFDRGLDRQGPGRNGGADPLALRDDLLRARAALAQAGPGGLDYAARFVEGLGRCAGDRGLEACARAALQAGDAALLMDALSERADRAGQALPI